MVPAAPVISESALKRRDRCAWNQAYNLHVNNVYAFVAHLVGGDRMVAEEIHQETWLAAIDHIKQFSLERGELQGWLLGIARRQVAMHFRRKSARSTAPFVDEPVVALGDGSSALLPDDVVEFVERREVVRAAMLALSSDCREVLISKYVDDLSVNEIALRRGCTPKAIESLLSRARARLRALVHWYFPAQPSDPKK